MNNEVTTDKRCVKCWYYYFDLGNKPCRDCYERDGKPKFEPRLQPAADPAIDTGTDSEFDIPDYEDDIPEPAPEPQPCADPDAPDKCDTCNFVFTDSAHCWGCDGRANYTPDADAADAVYKAAQPEPERSVYDIARETIYKIERQAVQLGIEAEWIEIKVDTVRKSAEVRDAKFHGTAFTLEVGE